MAYFVRYIADAAHAQSDLERGYSFRLYEFFKSRKAAAESDLAQFYGAELDDIVAFERDGATVYGFRLAGLCGFGSFDSVEEAREVATTERGYNGAEWPFVAIYTGNYRGEADAQDGQMFEPISLEEVISLW